MEKRGRITSVRPEAARKPHKGWTFKQFERRRFLTNLSAFSRPGPMADPNTFASTVEKLDSRPSRDTIKQAYGEVLRSLQIVGGEPDFHGKLVSLLCLARPMDVSGAVTYQSD